jgi:hypothetical protein
MAEPELLDDESMPLVPGGGEAVAVAVEGLPVLRGARFRGLWEGLAVLNPLFAEDASSLRLELYRA